ncbi:uncharacterized protein LOC126832166 [Patella vulgata]|uniref:uncharacterized protein LOC126832166 n=1 Tax=Patella vulgata TaxID=6465 RepID=UPI00217F9C20|nr:uncharacterized protein LOC126832166 [Patella vulgata]
MIANMKFKIFQLSLILLLSCVTLVSTAEDNSDNEAGVDDFFSSLFSSIFGSSKEDSNLTQTNESSSNSSLSVNGSSEPLNIGTQNIRESGSYQGTTESVPIRNSDTTENVNSQSSGVESEFGTTETVFAETTPIHKQASESYGIFSETAPPQQVSQSYNMLTETSQAQEQASESYGLFTDVTPTEEQASKSSIGDFFSKLFSGAEETSDITETINNATANYAVPTMKSPGVCKANPDLRDYCSLPESLGIYLKQNYTIDYLESTIFDCDVIRQLKANCLPGEWCLSKHIVFSFMQSSDQFLSSPICSSGLQTCLQTANKDQEGCAISKNIYNTDAAVQLLCEIGSQAGLTYECFGRVRAMLHVNLADVLRGDKILDDSSNPTECETQMGQQIKQYLCLLDLCSYQSSSLMSFKPWQWFLNDVDGFKSMCKYKNVCGIKEREITTTTLLTTAQPEINKNVADNSNIADEQMSSSQDNANTEHGVTHSFGAGTRTRMLVGLTAAVLVATFGLTMLVCALWKRINRHSKRYHPGYSKLMSEEAQPLYQ